MRTAFLVLALSGCVAVDDGVADMERVRGPGAAIAPASTEENLCGLAAELPASDPCSMLCDPEALKNVLLSEGQAAGRCYEFSCSFDAEKVSFGVCLDGEGPRPIPRTDSIM